MPDPRVQFFGGTGWYSLIAKEVQQLSRMGYERITKDDNTEMVVINPEVHKLKLEYMKLGIALYCKDPKKMAFFNDKSGMDMSGAASALTPHGPFKNHQGIHKTQKNKQ